MKAMDVKRLFIDTNILIYSTNSSSPWQRIALQTLEKARNQNIELVISQQILREYLATSTRISVESKEFTLEDILENIEIFRNEFTTLDVRPTVFDKLIELVQEFPTAGKQVHDANIVATMLVHGVGHLLTQNVDDFNRFSKKITVLSPDKWIQHSTN